MKDFEGESTFPGPDAATTATKKQLMGFGGDDLKARRREPSCLFEGKRYLLGRSGVNGKEVAGNEDAGRAFARRTGLPKDEGAVEEPRGDERG